MTFCQNVCQDLSSLLASWHADAGLQVPDAMRRSLRALLLQLAQASAVGLIDMELAESAAAFQEPLQAAQVKTSGQGRSLESRMKQAKITGASPVNQLCSSYTLSTRVLPQCKVMCRCPDTMQLDTDSRSALKLSLSQLWVCR